MMKSYGGGEDIVGDEEREFWGLGLFDIGVCKFLYTPHNNEVLLVQCA
jgi:hypothetical protein